MKKIPFINVSAIIFILLALLISLFPPFEFGNEKQNPFKGEYKLPVKKYDFILGDNKKDIILDYISFTKKFYNRDSLESYRDKWRDRKFDFVQTSIDSFFTQRRVLFLIPEKLRTSYPDFHISDSYNFPDNSDKIVKVNKDEKNTDAINYNDVKTEYNKHPNNWDYESIKIFDSIKKYDKYKITEPVYYSLERKILSSELFVEYILAILISLISGFLIQRLIPIKLDKFKLQQL
jgi:hypothetical protein